MDILKGLGSTDTKSRTDAADAMAALFSSSLLNVIQQAPTFSSMFGKEVKYPIISLGEQNAALRARESELQSEIDALKNHIGL